MVPKSLISAQIWPIAKKSPSSQFQLEPRHIAPFWNPPQVLRVIVESPGFPDDILSAGAFWPVWFAAMVRCSKLEKKKSADRRVGNFSIVRWNSISDDEGKMGLIGAITSFSKIYHCKLPCCMESVKRRCVQVGVVKTRGFWHSKSSSVFF